MVCHLMRHVAIVTSGAHAGLQVVLANGDFVWIMCEATAGAEWTGT